eukprot:g2438.t1
MAVQGGNFVIKTLQKMYQKSLTPTLRAYGLRYDDLVNEWHPDVQDALARLPPAEVEARKRRMQRAIDLDFKKKKLSPELQAMQPDPFEPVIQNAIEEAEAERTEREELLGKTPHNWDQPIIMGGTFGLAGLYCIWMGLKTM